MLLKVQVPTGPESADLLNPVKGEFRTVQDISHAKTDRIHFNQSQMTLTSSLLPPDGKH